MESSKPTPDECMGMPNTSLNEACALPVSDAGGGKSPVLAILCEEHITEVWLCRTAGVQIHSWGKENDDGTPNLEYVQPVQAYAVVNGEKTAIDLRGVPALTPRQSRELSQARGENWHASGEDGTRRVRIFSNYLLSGFLSFSSWDRMHALLLSFSHSFTGALL